MSSSVRELLHATLETVRALGDTIEVVENKSVCCYGPEFFVEIMPMKYHVRLILPLSFDEVELPSGLSITDAATMRFVRGRVHTEADMLIDVHTRRDLVASGPIVRRAFETADE